MLQLNDKSDFKMAILCLKWDIHIILSKENNVLSAKRNLPTITSQFRQHPVQCTTIIAKKGRILLIHIVEKWIGGICLLTNGIVRKYRRQPIGKYKGKGAGNMKNVGRHFKKEGFHVSFPTIYWILQFLFTYIIHTAAASNISNFRYTCHKQVKDILL